MKTLNKRVIKFGKRHGVVVTFTRVGGLWHAHGGLLPRPRRSIRDARAAVASCLARLASASPERLPPGSNVKWCGSRWVVVEWQECNGDGGSYWLRNRRGDDAVAGPDEIETVHN
jgi:hypothetical protein